MSSSHPSNLPARYCTVCGASAPARGDFCRECGSALEVPSAPASLVFCRDCGAQVALGDRYCPGCGNPQAPNVPARPREMAAPTDVRIEVVRSGEPDLAVRFLWFLFVGLWLGAAATVTAWLALITIIGAPLGLWILNRLPTVMTLRSPKRLIEIASGPTGSVVVRESRPTQLAFGTRAVYFACVGWWFSLVWLLLAYMLSILIVPLPLTMWMFEQVPLLTTLEQR
jgi:uncharacterized membrane protein YccF (DUF307 family)